MKKLFSLVLAALISASVFAGGLSGPGNYKPGAVAITGGTINGTTIGQTTRAVGSFTAGNFSSNLTVDGTIFGAGFTPYTKNATAAITGGTINGASIGATTPSTGAFTTLSASGLVSGAGFAVNTAYQVFGSVASTASLMPFDDTVPQNTEGAQFLTVTITPKSASSLLVINVSLFVTASTLGDLSVALFKDSVAGALSATSRSQAAGYSTSLQLNHVMVAGTTSPIAFKVRAGSDLAGTLTVNGYGGTNRLFGGVMNSFISVTEIRQ